MSGLNCARERELSELLQKGQWPDACSAELRAHVQSCRSCSDLLLVTQTMQAARKQAMAAARLESAGAIWWRAQLRRRNAAIETVARPILGAQIFAGAVAIVVAAVLLISQGSAFKEWFHDLPRALHLEALLPVTLSASGSTLWIIVPVLVTVILASGVVVYLSTEK